MSVGQGNGGDDWAYRLLSKAQAKLISSTIKRRLAAFLGNAPRKEIVLKEDLDPDLVELFNSGLTVEALLVQIVRLLRRNGGVNTEVRENSGQG